MPPTLHNAESSPGISHVGKCLGRQTHCSQDVCKGSEPGTETRIPPPTSTKSGYLSISVHHKMSSFSFMKTGKCWSLPCFMEFDLVVMVLTLLN